MMTNRPTSQNRSNSIRTLALRAAAGISLAIAAGPALAQGCDVIGYRIWQPGGTEARYAFGETVRLERGVEAHLYIHHASSSRNPFSTSAEIGHPSAVGLRAPFNDRVLRLQTQPADDRRAGRLVFTAKEVGRTALGYRISDVLSPGVFGRLAASCRRGVVTVEVVGAPRDNRPSADAQNAARTLAHTLEKALVPWAKASVDDAEMALVLGSGRAGLIEQAGQILRSERFRRESYFAAVDADPRLRAEADRQGDVEPGRVAESLLGGVYTALYGSQRPYDRLHRANVQDLLGCVTENVRRRAQACDQLAERLLSNAAFHQTFRTELELLSR